MRVCASGPCYAEPEVQAPRETRHTETEAAGDPRAPARPQPARAQVGARDEKKEPKTVDQRFEYRLNLAISISDLSKCG